MALAKKSAEPINFTSPGPRGVGHLAGEMLKQRAGIDMTHINYNGSAPALTDLIAGRVPLMFDIWHSAKRYVDSGELKLIAGAGAERLGDAPDVPTIAETYPGFDVIAFNALVAPAGVPAPVLDKLSGRHPRRGRIRRSSRTRSRHLGIFPLGNTPQELDAWMREQIARWAEIAKAANIKADCNEADVNNALHAIDCDVHPTVPGMKALLPYLDDYWRDTVEERGITRSRPSPIRPTRRSPSRPDWRGKNGRAATAASRPDGTGAATAGRPDSRSCNCLYGVQLLFSEDMAAAFARAVNDWVAQGMARPRSAAARLDRGADAEHRIRRRRDRALRAGPALRADAACWPCRRCRSAAGICWPIYAAAERHGLPIGIHAGSTYRHSDDLARLAELLHRGLCGPGAGVPVAGGSLICEGVFAKFPGLKVVLMESGVTWLPGFLWRLSKFWRGVRSEVPWVDRSPAEIVRDHVRLTIQPFDAPADPDQVERAIDHLRSDDILLYASDFPHWQFDGDERMPAGHSAGIASQDPGRQSARDLSALSGRTPDEHRSAGSPTSVAEPPRPRRHRRLRHPSQELARGSAALSEQALVGLSADLRRSASARATSRAFPIPRGSRWRRGAIPGRRAAGCRRAISTSCASSTSISTASNGRS